MIARQHMKPRSTIVFVHLNGEFVPAGRLDFFHKGEAVRANVSDGSRYASIFNYGTRYLARGDAVAVDPESLPLPIKGSRPQPVQTQEGFEIFNGIRDAAPDGWGRYLMDKAAPGHSFTELDYLLAAGDDRIGALAFGDDPARPPRREALWDDVGGGRLDLTKLIQATNSILETGEIKPKYRRYLEQGASIGGARPKASVDHEGKLWLAKFSRPDDSYNVMRAERTSMALAVECGLTIPKTAAIDVLGTTVCLIERFDRVAASDGSMRRIPFASALTMLAAHELAAHRYEYVDVANVIRRHGSSPEQDLKELFRRMAYNILISNTDDHLRNHGFLYDGKGWRLSPGYDIVPKPETSFERRLCLGVGTRGKEATLANAMTQCESFGLRPDEALALLEDMRARVAARWDAVCRENGVPAQYMERMATCIVVATNAEWQQELPRSPRLA